jgi:hypothetical protein
MKSTSQTSPKPTGWGGWTEASPWRRALALGWPCFLASALLAERAPLAPEQLLKEASLVVVGQITNLTIGTERSHIERGFGNYDWTIDLTLKMTAVEKGTLALSNAVVARCFRVKSRKSTTEYISVSGHHPIPDVGTTVRAHLYKQGGVWRVVFPNGLASVSGQTSLTDAPAVSGLRGGGYTYLLPLELWALIAAIAVVGAILFLIAKGIAGLIQRKR